MVIRWAFNRAIFMSVSVCLALWLGAVSSARAQVAATNCSATLLATSTGYRIQIPYLVYGSLNLGVDLDFVASGDGNIWFKVSGSTVLSSTTSFGSCAANTLSSDLYLDLPLLNFGSASYTASLQYVYGATAPNQTDLWFKVVDIKAITYVTANQSFASGLSIGSGSALVIQNATSPSSTTLDVQGDFTCTGDLEIWNSPASIRINVTGKATLGCNIRFIKDSSFNNLTIVASGPITMQQGFNPPTTGHVVVTDDASLIRSPEAYVTDATSDDGVTPSIIPTSDSGAIAIIPPAARRPLAAVAGCAGTHTLAGALAPPARRRALGQGTFDGTPVVLAAWFRCDVDVNTVKVDPPRWDEPPRSDTPDKTASNGRKGLTLNLKSSGKIKFIGDSVFTLMDGGKGQSKTVNGNPANAIAGNGGASGDLKIAAAGGIDLSAGTLTIVPGRGGDGGDAVAIGTKGADGCPGAAGALANATGGAGGESKKVLKARGFDPTGKVFVSDIKAGHGGNADANAGDGGNGTPGKCNGGAGGSASAVAGKGGDASFRYSGAGAVAAPATLGGNGGNASAQSGHGGNGGNRTTRCLVGGNGGAGGASTAKGGVAGTGSIAGTDGAASAGIGRGDGGTCGDFLSSNGTGGLWSEFTSGIQRNAGQFKAGAKDCSCTVTEAPKISVTPTEFVFTHVYGVSACPTFVGTMSIQNAGTGNFNWRMGSLPAWLSASKSSGSAGDTVQLYFTCVGYSANMAGNIAITGTDSATGESLSDSVSVPVSGTVR